MAHECQNAVLDESLARRGFENRYPIAINVDDPLETRDAETGARLLPGAYAVHRVCTGPVPGTVFATVELTREILPNAEWVATEVRTICEQVVPLLHRLDAIVESAMPLDAAVEREYENLVWHDSQCRLCNRERWGDD